MRAQAGDQLVVNGCGVGEHDRACRVLGVWDPNGESPYLVRWDDTGDAAILLPEPGAIITNCGPTGL